MSYGDHRQYIDARLRSTRLESSLQAPYCVPYNVRDRGRAESAGWQPHDSVGHEHHQVKTGTTL